jgi:hypothetical protein
MGKRGPKREDGKREPNGRLSRRTEEQHQREATKLERDEWDAMYVALLARWRVHNVPLAEVRNQMAGSYVGRLCLNGEVTQTQYDAALTYLSERRDFHMAVGAPKEDATAIDLNAVHGRSGAENVERDRLAKAQWEATRKAIAAKQEEEGLEANLWAALDLCLHRDMELPHMVPDLRSVLNALVRRYRLVSREAA